MFEDLRIEAVCLNVFEFNQRAVRCYQKCGFEEIEAGEQGFEHNGKHWRWLTLRCTPESFKLKRLRCSKNGTAPGKG